MSSGKLILRNSIVLYLRMFLSMGIGLYSTRIILLALGVNDYGIYNLVAGVVGMFTFLNASMSASTQRFISHTLGANNTGLLKKVLSTSILIHILIAIVVLLLLEIIGLPLLKNLNIPVERVQTARIVFHIVVLSTLFSILTSPFDGCLVAHENFILIAFSEIFLSLAKLGTAVYLLYTGFDKLIVSTLLGAMALVIQLVFKQAYCLIKYEECNYRFQKYFDWKVFKEMLHFAGWNLFGVISYIGRNQGIAVLMNVYFGVAINAAYGIANQVNGQLSSLSSVAGNAISPQLTKAEGEGNRERVLKLGILASKIPFMLLSLTSIPLIIEMPFVLGLWLKNVPTDTVLFTRLILIMTVVGTLSSGFIRVIHAIGRIRNYQLIVGAIILLNLPITYVFYQLGFPSYYAVLVAIILEAVLHLFSMIVLKKLTDISIKRYLIDVDFPLILVVLLSSFATYFATRMIGHDFLRLVVAVLLNSLLMGFGWYRFSLELADKGVVKSYVKKFKIFR